jgi:hypothetical protein
MPIAILGSWNERRKSDPDYPLKETHDKFAEACEDIGRELARHEQQVIVARDAPTTADYHIVKGIVETAAVDRRLRPLIHIIEPKEGEIFWDFRRQYGDYFIEQERGTPHSAEAATIIAVRDADAVLTIGGRNRTYSVGLAAILARKRLVPIGSFGGTSRRLLGDVVKYGEVTISSSFRSLSNPWNTKVRDAALYLAGVTKRPKILIIHGLSREDRLDLQIWLRNKLELSQDDVVLMADVPADGRTLTEKFEDLAAEVDAAIAIATPDDVGGPQTEAPAHYKLRARQNVWLEVGWFWGRLGRDKIMVLRKGDVEIPSDLKGLEYHPYTTIPSEAGERIRDFVDVIQRGGRIQR